MFCGRSSPGLLLAGRLGTWLKHQDTNWLWNTFKSTTSINTHTPHENDTLQDQSKTNFNCLINCRHTKTKPVNTQATRVLYSSPRAEITNQFFGQFQNQLLDGERLQLVVNDDDGRMDSKQVKYKPRSIFNWNILLEPSSTLHYSTNDRIGGGGGGGGGSSCAAHHLYSCIRQSKWRGPNWLLTGWLTASILTKTPANTGLWIWHRAREYLTVYVLNVVVGCNDANKTTTYITVRLFPSPSRFRVWVGELMIRWRSDYLDV